MWQEILYSAIRAVFGYILFMVVARIMGQKTISQMTFFTFVVAITLGSVTANLALGSNPTPYSSATIIVVFTMLTLLTEYIHIKSMKGRKILNSEPVVIIDSGQIVNKNMERVRLTLNELAALLREKNVFSMADVEFAVLEADGKLSVLPKAQRMPLTPSDMNIQSTYKGLTKDLILDGNIMEENLTGAGKDEKWLLAELAKQGIKDVKSVFYAGLDSSNSLYVSVKKEANEEHGQYGID